jgi:hypothetical protein
LKKLVLALVGSLGLTVTGAVGAAADFIGTQVILSCNDGHSVTASLDQVTLTNLVADIQAINASGTGLSCTLDTAVVDPSSQTTEWKVYDYNPSNRAIAPRNSPNSMPATTPDGGTTWQFNFQPSVYTALFTTTDPSVTGNLCPSFPLGCRTLSDSIATSGSATTFMTQRGGGDCVGNTPATVRFYFRSPSASGPSTGSPPAGFYTQFWWSDNARMHLLSGNDSLTITESLANLSGWSDWNGQRASDFPGAFIEATQHVQAIGLSFGGDCFFETGVTAVPASSSEQFSSMFSET